MRPIQLAIAGLFLLAAGPTRAASPDDRARGELRAYLSSVDGSRQAYGLYLPRANAPSERGFPVVLHAHGYGWDVSAGFSEWQRDWADDHGWVLVNVNGRGPNFYDGIGDDDVMCVLEDIAGLLPVDRTRVFATGGSMGGTGAYRMAVRRPDVFAGAGPVDGWTDYRLFHKHWYERKDMGGAIEEFRRPLLEAISPALVAETARWTNLQLIVDDRDTTVEPEEGVRLSRALDAARARAPDGYRHELVLHRDLGHGAGYDLRRIYGYFLGVGGLERPPAVSIRTTLLRYGEVHWAHLDRFRMQGALGGLEVEVSGPAAHVVTMNLDGFGLKLGESPLADEARVQVVADGLPCYDGPPRETSFAALRDSSGGLMGWSPVEALASGLVKRRGLEGPIGEAFLRPFVIAYGVDGEAAAVARAREEAEDFAREWNDFNVHYAAVRARREDELTRDEIEGRNLVLFGDLGTSSLVRRIDAATMLPVRVLDDRVIVRDPANGDRAYLGRKYGAYWVYPNPLSGFTTLVVGLKGRFVTTRDGRTRRGLGYDLEKLQWAWGDYVVFDSEPQELPYVENVNNKDSTLCYEAAYFVEAGFCDRDWRPDRSLELNRVRALRPEGSRLVHLDRVAATGEGVRVRVVDEGGGPVKQARVTVSWTGGVAATVSRLSDGDGVALFPRPRDLPAATALRAEVVNVCATGATYAWPDDRARSAAVGGDDAAVRVLPGRGTVSEGGCATFTVRVRNDGDRPGRATVAAPGGPGRVSPLLQEVSVAAGAEAEARFVWDAGGLRPGDYELPLTVRLAAGGPGAIVRTATARFTVEAMRRPLIEIAGVGAPDRRFGEGWEVVARVRSRDALQPARVAVNCVLVEARRYLPTQVVRLEPWATVEVRWRASPNSAALGVGVHTARVSLPDLPGAIAETTFVVK